MAGSKVTALTVNTNAAGEDLVYLVDDPTGGAGSRKITITNLLGSINVGIGFGTDSTHDIGTPTVRPAVVYADVVDTPLMRGGSSSAGDIRIDSTSHGTPGKVYFGGGNDTYYEEANEKLHLVSIASVGEVKVIRPSALYFAIGTAYEGDTAWRFAINGRGDLIWADGEGVAICPTVKLWETMAHIADPTNDGETQTAVASIIDGLKLMGLMAPNP
jgi:hypothetical protein